MTSSFPQVTAALMTWATRPFPQVTALLMTWATHWIRWALDAGFKLR